MLGLGLGLTSAQRVQSLQSVLQPGATQLAIYQPWDFSTLRQDRAGTTPVTAAGQLVGQILDVSGFGNHATAIADANRMPINEGSGQRWLAFNGTSGAYGTAAINPGSADKVQIFAVVRALSNTEGIIAQFGASGAAGSARLVRSQNGLQGYRALSRGLVSTEVADAGSGYPSPITNVVTGIGDIGAPLVALRLNGAQVASSVTSQGGGAYGNHPLFIGALGGTSLFFSGLLYALVIRWGTTNLSASQILQVERLLAPRGGLVI